MYGPAATWVAPRRGVVAGGQARSTTSPTSSTSTTGWTASRFRSVSSPSCRGWCATRPSPTACASPTPRARRFVYSGDTGYCDALIELASGADVFLCEASWTHSPTGRRNLHLSGTEAGRAAAKAGVRELLLTHIPPWTSREDVISEAKAEFDGPVHAVVCDESFDVVRTDRVTTR